MDAELTGGQPPARVVTRPRGGTGQRGGRRVAARLPLAVALAAVAAGAAQRWWAAAHPIGTLTSDGSVIGLMALRLLEHGQLTAYMWGQSYGGGLEADLTAAVFAVAGTGAGQLLATTALTSALCALAVWRAGRHVVGEVPARLAALVLWVWPASFIWRSVKPGGTYLVGLALALCAVGALARVRDGEAGWYRCGVAGLCCGLAVWSSPMSLELLIPAAAWVLPSVIRQRRASMLAVIPGGVLGWLPGLVFGATHDWTNLHMPGRGADLLTGAPARLRQFFPVEAPIAMGVRVEGSLAWLGGYVGEVLAWAGLAGLLVAAALVLAGRASRCALPVLTLVLLPILYSLIELADNIGQGRYALFAVPMAALLLGVGIERCGLLLARRADPAGVLDVSGSDESGGSGSTAGSAVAHAVAGASRAGARRQLVAWVAGLTMACALGTAGLVSEPGRALVAFPAPDVAMPENDAALRTLLASHRITDAYATYWMAYRVMFETGGQTRVTPFNLDRYPPIGAAVDASPRPAYLFLTASATRAGFEAWCRQHSVGYQAWQAGGFTVVQPAVKVTPAELPASIAR